MTDRRLAAWVRVLCALALGLGLTVATAAATNEAFQTRPAIAQAHHGFDDIARSATRAPAAFGHAIKRHVPPSAGVALVLAAVLVGGLGITGLRSRRTSDIAGRRISPTSARAPPVAIGI